MKTQKITRLSFNDPIKPNSLTSEASEHIYIDDHLKLYEMPYISLPLVRTTHSACNNTECSSTLCHT